MIGLQVRHKSYPGDASRPARFDVAGLPFRFRASGLHTGNGDNSLDCTGLVAYTLVFVPSLGQSLRMVLDQVTLRVLGVRVTSRVVLM